MDCYEGTSGETDTLEVHKLSVRWSDQEGEYQYVFSALQESSNGERRLKKQSYGDAAWAERMSKHYGIELPEVKE